MQQRDPLVTNPTRKQFEPERARAVYKKHVDELGKFTGGRGESSPQTRDINLIHIKRNEAVGKSLFGGQEANQFGERVKSVRGSGKKRTSPGKGRGRQHQKVLVMGKNIWQEEETRNVSATKKTNKKQYG